MRKPRKSTTAINSPRTIILTKLLRGSVDQVDHPRFHGSRPVANNVILISLYDRSITRPTVDVTRPRPGNADRSIALRGKTLFFDDTSWRGEFCGGVPSVFRRFLHGRGGKHRTSLSTREDALIFWFLFVKKKTRPFFIFSLFPVINTRSSVGHIALTEISLNALRIFGCSRRLLWPWLNVFDGLKRWKSIDDCHVLWANDLPEKSLDPQQSRLDCFKLETLPH